MTDKGFTFIKNDYFRNSDEKINYYKNVTEIYDYSLEDMFDNGFRVNLF